MKQMGTDAFVFEDKSYSSWDYFCCLLLSTALVHQWRFIDGGWREKQVEINKGGRKIKVGRQAWSLGSKRRPRGIFGAAGHSGDWQPVFLVIK